MFEWERFNLLKNSNVLEPIFTSEQKPTSKRPSYLNELLLKKYRIKSKGNSQNRFAKSSNVLKNSVNERNSSLNNLIHFPDKLLSIEKISFKKIDKRGGPKLSPIFNSPTPTSQIDLPRKALSPDVFKNLNPSLESTQKPLKKMIIEGKKNSYFSPKSTNTTVQDSSYTNTQKAIHKHDNLNLSQFTSNTRLLKRLKKHQIYSPDHLKPFSTRMLSQTPMYRKPFLIP